MYRGISTTKRLTASGAVKPHKGIISKIQIEGTGSVGYVKLYDATSATGTPLWQIAVPADNEWTWHAVVDLDFPTAIYAELSGATLQVVLY
jgi:hypothetical protein